MQNRGLKRNIAIIIFTILISTGALTQEMPEWTDLPNAPFSSRHNDVYFVTDSLGWICDGNGAIYHTPDGGQSWQQQFLQTDAHFRSIAFLDSLNGWAGNVGLGEFGATDGNIFYHTSDGGQSWSTFNTFAGPAPAGVCGMYVVNDSTIVAVGRVRGPAFFAKTTNRGQTWTSKDMGEYAAGLIDVYFFSPDTGVAVGLTNSNHEQSSGIVLGTTDGGQTWEERHRTDRTGEWCWKLTFPSRQVGYASLQRNSRTPIYILKTVDGGQTWESKLFSSSYYFVQGLGFATEEMGWIGGNSSQPVFQTTDGGETWSSAGFGVRVNRFRFLRPDFGYAVGRTVYKYSSKTAVSVAASPAPPTDFRLAQNYPNPFNPDTRIEYELAVPDDIELSIFNLLGERVRTLFKGGREAGSHLALWDGRNEQGVALPSGIYVYRLKSGREVVVRRMLLLR